MLNKKHSLIYILIAGIIFILSACSNGNEPQVPTTAASTDASNYNAPDMPGKCRLVQRLVIKTFY